MVKLKESFKVKSYFPKYSTEMGNEFLVFGVKTELLNCPFNR